MSVLAWVKTRSSSWQNGLTPARPSRTCVACAVSPTPLVPAKKFPPTTKPSTCRPTKKSAIPNLLSPTDPHHSPRNQPLQRKSINAAAWHPNGRRQFAPVSDLLGSHGRGLRFALPRIIHEAWAPESVAAAIRDSDAMKRSLWFSFTGWFTFLVEIQLFLCCCWPDVESTPVVVNNPG